MTRDSDAHNSTNGIWFDNTTEYVIKFKTRLLIKTLSNQPTLIMIQLSMTIELVITKPITANNVGIGNRKNEI